MVKCSLTWPDLFIAAGAFKRRALTRSGVAGGLVTLRLGVSAGITDLLVFNHQQYNYDLPSGDVDECSALGSATFVGSYNLIALPPAV